MYSRGHKCPPYLWMVCKRLHCGLVDDVQARTLRFGGWCASAHGHLVDGVHGRLVNGVQAFTLRFGG